MKCFWDTNLFIYLWEDSEHTQHVSELARLLDARDGQICTSALTIAEILVHPIRQGGTPQAAEYLERFDAMEIITFGTREAVVFAAIRAGHATMSPPDAIQLACASTGGAEMFVTNDSRLEALSIPGIDKTLSLDGAIRELRG